MEKIRLGTIGTGVIVESVLGQMLKQPQYALTAVYSRSEEKGRALAEKFGGARNYTDLGAFLADAEMNTVYIASPNSLHYDQTRAALLAGKHVLCEKPFCTAAAKARELAALAKEKGLMLAEAVPTAFLPNLEVIRRNLPGIGRLRLVQGNYSQYSSRYDAVRAGKELPNVFNPEFGGGCLMDLNYYNVYLNVALFGKPRKVQYYPNRIGGDGVDSSGILMMEYGDFLSQAAGAKDTWYDSSFSVQGEDGFIQISGGSNGLRQVRVVTKECDETFSRQPDPERLSYEAAELGRIFLDEDRQKLDELMEVTLAVMEVLEEGKQSAGLMY